MALPTAYLTSTKNLEDMLNAIQNAQAPERFTIKFLESLEFKSSSDRLIIGVLKALGFLDDAGAPTPLYYKFLDQTESRRVLAEAIRMAYDDLFRINKKANEFSQTEVRNKLKTLTEGQKGDRVLTAMTNTFVALCALADWTQPIKPAEPEKREQPKVLPGPASPTSDSKSGPMKPLSLGQLAYNIQIMLPVSRDQAVYDALFRALKEHLLT